MAATTPSVSASLAPDGTLTSSVTVNTATLPTAINWTALLQWLTTYGPNVIAAFAALIAIFGSPTPAPPAPPALPHEVKP
jgi:hypothetical protein